MANNRGVGSLLLRGLIDQFDGFGLSDECSLALAPTWTLAESRDRAFRES